MQKHNFVKKTAKIFKISLLSLFLIGLFSCKTLPNQSKTKVNALDLLDYTNNFYLSVPTKTDPELVKRILQSNVNGLSDEDTKKLLERIDHTYIGLTRNWKNTTIQASANVNIPTKFLPTILSKKKGWEKRVFTASEPASKYDVYAQNGMELCVPENSICCLGANMDYMIEKYNQIYNTPSDTVSEPNQSFSSLPKNIYDYLSGNDEVIRFYTVKPQTYLSMLIGTNINLQLVTVCGEIRPDPQNKNMLLLDFVFEFKSELVKKAGQALLSYTFALTNPEVSSDSPTVLKVSGIQLEKEAIYKLLVL